MSSQLTLGLPVALQVLFPQPGGLEVPEITSLKASR